MWAVIRHRTAHNPRVDMSRVFAISDLHVDYKENLAFVNSWSNEKYRNDALIVAGDVTDKLAVLESTLVSFKRKFREVFYVPGNHELWIRGDDQSINSCAKFFSILELCSRIGVRTEPSKFTLAGNGHVTSSASSSQCDSVWIVPLFGWYAKPEEDSEDSLYIAPPPNVEEKVELYEQYWMDNHLCRWPVIPAGQTLSGYFADQNKLAISKKYDDAPVISFSHFVPRSDLIRASEDDMNAVNAERRRANLEQVAKLSQGGAPGFNFTRYAGCKQLETQLRQLGSQVHVYGHQHRNRSRLVDGVQYVAHCLGNPQEQKQGWTWGIKQWQGPKQVWPPPTAAGS